MGSLDEIAARECDHEVDVPFDREASKGLTADEVRRRWPRFTGPCPKCGEPLIAYASFEHYIAGDW